MSAGVDLDVGSAVLKYRLADGQNLTKSAHRTSVAALFDADPWRTFSWHQGQRHYSGKYWSATEGDHVIYESRLELSALLMADFDPAVSRIKAQPFLLTALVGPRTRRHVPDYFAAVWGVSDIRGVWSAAPRSSQTNINYITLGTTSAGAT